MRPIRLKLSLASFVFCLIASNAGADSTIPVDLAQDHFAATAPLLLILIAVATLLFVFPLLAMSRVGIGWRSDPKPSALRS